MKYIWYTSVEENLAPRHNNCCDGYEEEHIQFDAFRKVFLDAWQFAYGGSHNHEQEQEKGKPALLFPAGSYSFPLASIRKTDDSPHVWIKLSSVSTTSVSPSRKLTSFKSV